MPHRSTSGHRRLRRLARTFAALTAVSALALLTLAGCGTRADESDAVTPGDAPAGRDEHPAAPETRADGEPSRPADSGDTARGPDACAPSCRGRACGDDGCGGSCGTCPPADECSAEGRCLPRDPDCEETCASLGIACGEHCGEPCGPCPGAQDECDAGRCVCRPACTVATCEQDDGCGGTCDPCPRDVSCEDCPLRLVVTEREEQNGVLRYVTLALDYAPTAHTPLPGMADLRIAVEGDATLTRVALGEALLAADKSLHVDALTGRPYRELPGGVIQCLILSLENRDVIPGGRWLFFRFRLGATGAPPGGAARFALVAREETFAPPPADQALWGAGLDTPVVVWAEVAP
jgi:hypothetical protein